MYSIAKRATFPLKKHFFLQIFPGSMPLDIHALMLKSCRVLAMLNTLPYIQAPQICGILY